MPTFANLSQYVSTVTDKLTKPRRGVGGSEGVLASDMLSAMIDVGTFASEKVDSIIGTNSLKTPLTHYGTAKGLEMWATGGAAWGISPTFLEASIKTKTTGTGEVEFWNTFLETDFTFRDGGPRTERFKLKAGHAWLPNNLHVGVGADRTNYGSALFVNGGIRQGNTLSNKKIALWVDAENDHEYYGFGLNSAVMRYQVATPGADHVFYAGAGGGSSTELMRIRGNGNVVIAWGYDNNLAKLQTPSISLDVNTWNYSSDGQQRLYYQINGATYHKVPSGQYNFFRFGLIDSYQMSQDSFIQYSDNISDFTQLKTSTAVGATNRSWNHRKEASGVDYRFFDWDGSSARDWWNVYASTQKMSLAQIIHANYGSNVGIGTSTPDNRAILDLASTERGLLLPRLTTAQRDAQTGWQNGTIIYNTSIPAFQGRSNGAWVNL